MAKQPRDQQSVIITPAQARAVIALQFERGEIVQRVNKQMAEIAEAVQEQGRMLARIHQLLAREGVTYRFDSADVDGESRVRLTAVPKPEEPEKPEVVSTPPAPDQVGETTQ